MSLCLCLTPNTDLFAPIDDREKFETEDERKRESEVTTTIDEILDKFGEDSIRRGGWLIRTRDKPTVNYH